MARQLSDDDWRKYMKPVRKIAFELRDAGKVCIMQKGRVVEGNEVIGPIRIQLK